MENNVNIIDKTIRDIRRKLNAKWFTYGFIVGVMYCVTIIIIITIITHK